MPNRTDRARPLTAATPNAPTKQPAKPSSNDSVTTRRATEDDDAPIAIRTAISRRR
jgi:hypothetical protein